MRQPFSRMSSRLGSQSIRLVTRTLLVMVAGAASGALGQPPSTVTLPDGPGKAATQRICSACHGVDVVAAERHPRTEWQKVVDDMAARGADGTDAELKSIVDYLAKYFGPKPTDGN